MSAPIPTQTARRTAPGTPRRRIALLVVAAAGLIHTSFSLLWAAGGTLLLDTVGPWASTLAAADPTRLQLTFAILALVKASAALIPLLLLLPHPPLQRTITAISWIGGITLLAVSAWRIIGNLAILVQGAPYPAETDHLSLLWNTALWQPLFFIWGAALIIALIPLKSKREP